MMRRPDRFTGWCAIAVAAVLSALLFCIKEAPRLFAPGRQTVTVRFPDVTGLQEGDDVRANGVLVGIVDRLAFDGTGVRAELALTAPPELREDARFRMLPRSLLGGWFVDVDQGTGPLAGAGAFAGTGPADLFEVVGDLVASLSGSTREPSIIANVRAMSQAINERHGILGMAIKGDSELAGDVGAISDAFARGGDNLRFFVSGDEPFGEAVADLGTLMGSLGDDERALGFVLGALADPNSPGGRLLAEAGAEVDALRAAYEARGGSLRLLDRDAPLWRAIEGLFETLRGLSDGEGGLAGDLLVERGQSRRLAGAFGDALRSLGAKVGLGELGGSPPAGGERRPDLVQAFQNVFLFFGFDRADIRQRSYFLQFYNFLQFVGVLPPLVGD